MTAFNLPFNQQVSVTAQFEDVAGNAAVVVSATVASSDETILKVTIPAVLDNVSEIATVVTPVGPLGNATVTVTGTTATGTVITGTQDFSVVADVASQVKIIVGTPSAIVVAS